MKKVLFITLMAIVATACHNDEIESDRFYISPNAMVYIKPASGVKSASADHLTALEIVKQAAMIEFRNERVFGAQNVDCGFNDLNRDTVSNPPRLKRWATDLINYNTAQGYHMVKDIIYGENVVFSRLVNGKRDTIAYTPNSVMRKMEADIIQALAEQDTVLAYQVFNESFTFTPITGPEYRTLMKNGSN
jgi:hypothetical protein